MHCFDELKRCKVCNSTSLTEVYQIAPQFLSPTFVQDNSAENISKIKVPMTLLLCDKSKNPEGCGLLQLREEVLPNLLYSQYFYRSSTSATMRHDLRLVIEDIMSKVQLNPGDSVVDIGANDATMLGFYPDNLHRVGYEPAKNIERKNLPSSITIINDYFSSVPFKNEFPNKKVKAFSCCAMFYDLSNPHQFVSDIKEILDPNGLWCIQLSYLPLMLTNRNFYDICHEHLSYYSLKVLESLMQKNGLRAFDASVNEVNGGSLRLFVTHAENKSIGSVDGENNLARLRALEASMHLDQLSTYQNYFKDIETLAGKVRGFITNEIDKGEKVLGLGASTKGNVLIQFLGITKEILPSISERNPDKIGLKTLGTDIELISEDAARNLRPSTMLVLPWYFKNEIVAREEEYINNGGSLLFPMPYPHVVSKSGERLL